MESFRLESLRLAALVMSCAATLSACAAAPVTSEDLFSERAANAYDPATIDAIGDNVTDWQIAHLDKLSEYVRDIRSNTTDRRAWVLGDFYV